MGTRPTRHPSLESVDEIKESLEVGLRRRGDPLDGFVTYRDLDLVGLIDGRFVGRGQASLRPGRLIGGPGGPGTGVEPIPPPNFGENDLTPPPAPENVRARGMSNTSIGVTWNPPGYNNHAYAEIFASFQPSWSGVAETFNASAPIGPGNITQFFMGRSSGSSFLHSDLGSTVPSPDFGRPIINLTTPPSGGFVAELDGDQRALFQVGSEVYLRSEAPWQGNGIQGQVAAVVFFTGSTFVTVESATVASPPPNLSLVAIPDEDALDDALNPRAIYYWVRFVSTARISGPVQSEEGEPGRVMINATEVLDILTGRIRSTQLANDLITPINFVRGPITELDEDGNRLYPTIRDFVLAQGDAILTEYDEVLNEVLLGNIAPEDSPWAGAVTAAALISQVTGLAEDNEVYIETLKTLQAGFETGTEDGLESIIATLMERRLVRADDAGALSYLSNTLQVQTSEGGLFLNDVAQRVVVNEGNINNAYTVRLQGEQNGILTAAGFGIGLEGQLGGSLISTFAVAADQFAIMGAGVGGRRVSTISRVSSTRVRVFVPGGVSELGGVQQDFGVGERVSLTIPAGAQPWKVELRGRTFRVVSAPTLAGSTISILLEPSDGIVAQIGTQNVEGEGVAIFQEQSIPFIVDTASGTVGIRGKLIVDGMINTQELEVTELLRANEIWSQSITNFGLIRTSSLVGETIATPRYGGWAMRINSPDTSQVNRVFQYSRWESPGHNQPFGTPPYTDSTPDPSSDNINQLESLYPQLGSAVPTDTAFWINAQGRAYIRASLEIGGNARILTRDPANMTNSRYFFQSDAQFPMMIYPYGQVAAAGQSWNNPEDQWTYTPGAIAAVRQHALFWVNADGTAGFNTRNSSIFVGDTPMEPPSGFGYATVRTRLEHGIFTGRGRVMVSANFGMINDQYFFGPDARFACHFGLYLASANESYANLSVSGAVLRLPSQYNGAGGSFIGAAQLNFLDQHVVIIRGTGAGPDPGMDAYLNWQAVAPGIRKVTEVFDQNWGGMALSGAVDGVPAGNYKILVVVVERFDQDGNPVPPNDMDRRSLPYNLSPCLTQISTVAYSGPTSSNGGGSPPPGGGGSPPPSEPGPINPGFPTDPQ